MVFASPHSGNRYPEDFLAASRLDQRAIRRSEDAFIDTLFSCVPDFGAPLISAHFPRAYVDPNREAYELDPNMFDTPLPDWVNTKSPRVQAGLGTVAKIVAGGAEIYREPLDFTEVRERIEACYKPYHAALQSLIDDALKAFGHCLLIDCHSMPSMVLSNSTASAQPDIVLGDLHGSSCGRDIVHVAERTFRDLGLRVHRNKPYAGGFTTRHYAEQSPNVQTLQIEINRALYMDETLIRRHSGFERMRERARLWVARITNLERDLMNPPIAAE